MSKPLSLAVAQPRCASYDLAKNATAHSEAVRAAKARVIALPELSLTGYQLDAPVITAADPRLAPIAEACWQTGSVALIGAPLRSEEDHEHIGMLAVRDGEVSAAYAKMWLSAEEAERFTASSKPAVLEVDGWRLGLAICKDTGEQQQAADTVAICIDAYVAGTVKRADESALQHEGARHVATDHQVWVAVSSFVGSTGHGFRVAAGRSAVWAPSGDGVAEADGEIGAVATATLA